MQSFQAGLSNVEDAVWTVAASWVMAVQAKVGENLQKQAQLMEVISKNQAAYRQAFGFDEWRRACEVSCTQLPSGLLAAGLFLPAQLAPLHSITTK